ncbi:methyltransferase domain-containing protein [Micromonospora sp. DR5-3]|uniref:class I SAM-dependent methyltransferase n=1 Tax=unclassified Micromonospora TaxID=2617518 RepID=UPI0011D2F833|nr:MULTISPECIES: methyltransferase domain-containing protein [unclassified Micromonospora]MCW3817502.1 methyltransferase domain-containing protein [Micromonospora sp. DR5-3]TYC25216.1 methyltransferase domain-containing protein [Micromonospora sp. MP36]
MGTIVNEHQEQAWNGYEGRHWAAHQARYDAINIGFNELLLAAVRPGDRVLDIGCGNGQLTRLAARRSGTGHAFGIDLSAPMLERARASAADEGVDNVDFVRADAQVHPFPAAGFHVALSRFGVMFFADPVAAFANVRRALRPGGRLAFVCLDDVRRGDLGAVFGSAAAHLPPPATDGTAAGEPLSFADPDVVRGVLADAGFVDVACAPRQAVGRWGRDAADAADFLAGWGPIQHQLGPLEPAVTERVRAALAEAMRPHEGPDGVHLRNAAWLVTARCPD